jgi:SAM-dependent methyltransferase
MTATLPISISVKRNLKRMLPSAVARVLFRSQRYAQMDLQSTFEHIYSAGDWAGSSERGLCSGPGSRGRYVEEYCQMLSLILRDHRVKSLADLGCGDFNTGLTISRMVDSYIGVDIAGPVIEANTRAFADDRVRFLQADLTSSSLPEADAGILRQVLQHLSNREIGRVLGNVLRTYPLVVITEHIYVGPKARPNVDIPHGAGTRIHEKSGVFIDQFPFLLEGATFVGDIHYGQSEVLRTWVCSRYPQLRAD